MSHLKKGSRNRSDLSSKKVEHDRKSQSKSFLDISWIWQHELFTILVSIWFQFLESGSPSGTFSYDIDWTAGCPKWNITLTYIWMLDGGSELCERWGWPMTQNEGLLVPRENVFLSCEMRLTCDPKWKSPGPRWGCDCPWSAPKTPTCCSGWKPESSV